MKSLGFIALAACGVLSIAAEPQQTYDGRNGPHVFGPPGNQIYIRGQNEGRYSVPGVGGQFENALSRGEHIYTDEQGNTYVNHKNAGGPASHTISGPTLSAQNLGPARFDVPNGGQNAAAPPSGRSHIQNPFHVEHSDHALDFGNGRTHQRSRRSSQDEYDGNSPRRRGKGARVQGPGFAASENGAGVWSTNISVWKRTDGRSVILDEDDSAIVSGRRGTHRYS